jgi:23S rRNA (uracil1939-C5)-methyltransferase
MADQVYTIEKLVAGGMGIVHDGPQTIFIPFVIPGEQVKIRVELGTHKPLRAAVQEFISRSPERVAPPCPLFMRCGGCQFQHLAYPAQVSLKWEILAETLLRLGHLQAEPSPVIPSPKSYHYRRRIKLHVQAGQAGFYAEWKKELVPVPYCYLAEDTINRALATLAEFIERDRARSIELIVEEGTTCLAVVESRREEKIYRRQEGKSWRPAPEQKIVFQQVNPEQNQALRKLVSGLAAEIRPSGVIELYAGSGNLTEVILPHGGWMIAVDADRAAVELARETLEKTSSGRVKFAHQAAETYLASALKTKLKPDLIVLDPPRTGAKEAIPGIIRLEPAHIIYVSCDPASLARDLKALIAAGYQLHSLTPLDMFPQTAHIEAVAALGK